MDSDSIKVGVYLREKGRKYNEFDTLGLDSIRENFEKVIKTAVPPLTIGLYGPWGSGKTEMIKALSENLINNECLTLIFDSWKYRYEQNLILPLICALRREHLPAEAGKDKAKNIVTSTALVMANQFIKNKIGIDVGEVCATSRSREAGYEHYKKYEDKVASIEKEYKEFIDAILKKAKKKRLVIFIDNLDRCLPDVVVNLLEDISSFLSISNTPCIYVLAADKENVVKAINHRYPDFDGVHYLEKIVHIPLRMPLPRKREGNSSNYGMYHFTERYKQAKRQSDVSRVGDFKEELLKKLERVDDVFASEFLGNPRRTERIVNKLMVLELMELFSFEKNSDDLVSMVFLLLLSEHFPKIYNSLKTSLDFQELLRCLQNSLQKQTLPHRMRHKRDNESANLVLLNEVVFNAYCDSERFFNFVKGMSGLANVNKLVEKLVEIKSHLDCIG